MGNLYDSFAEMWDTLSLEERYSTREEFKALLVQHGKEDLLKPFLILEHLGEYLATNPLPIKEAKFNSPGYPEYICDRVCERMSNDEKMSCTREDILLLWLTKALYGYHYAHNSP